MSSWAEKRRRAAALAAAPATPTNPFTRPLVPLALEGPGEFQLTFFKQHREYFRSSMFALPPPPCSAQAAPRRPLLSRVPPLQLPHQDFPECLWLEEHTRKHKQKSKGVSGAFKPNVAGVKNKRLMNLHKFLKDEVDKLESDDTNPLNKVKTENESDDTKTPIKHKIQVLEDLLRAPKTEESSEDYKERMNKLDEEKRKAMGISGALKFESVEMKKEESEDESDEERGAEEEEDEGAEYEDEGDYGKNYYDSDDGMAGDDDGAYSD